MATIYDVAKIAGVSPKTVSRVLNGDAPVGAKTRAAVEKAMTELGYVPSSAARMMRSNKSGIIGLVTGAISRSSDTPEPAGLPDLFIVQGIQRIMAAHKKTLMISDTMGDVDTIPHLLRTFQEHRAEGVIYVADHHKEVELPEISEDLPIVLANCFDATGRPSILPNDRKGQRDLIARLIKAGHSRIAFIQLPQQLVAMQLRHDGYRDALAEAGIAYDEALLDHVLHDEDPRLVGQLREALDRLLALEDKPTVICCGNDKLAMRVYGILRAKGVDIPGEISIAGFDNYELIAGGLFPPLTTVDLPYAEMGARAAERLLALIDGQASDTPNPELIDGPVHWRSSVTDFFSTNVTMFQSNGRTTS